MCARVVAKTFCEKCNKWVSNSNWKKHELAHQKHPERFEVEYHRHNSDFTCMFCGKQCKNSNSVLNHQNYCKQNPNRILTTFEKQGAIPNFNEKGRVSNRKGLNHSVDGESGPNLNMLNYIFNGSKIKYSIQLTVDQIERLDTILSEVDEMESIKSKIKSFSETIVGLIG